MNLSIFEKISVIFELFTHSPFAILALFFAIFLAISLLINLYIDKKYIKLIFPVLYVLFIGVLLFNYRANFLQGISLFIDDLFFKAYFPSVALYFAMLIINALVLFISMFSKKMTNYSKVVNIISFSLLQMLFALFLYVATTKQVTIHDWSSLYQDREVLSLLETSMGVFLSWIFLLFIGFGFSTINEHWGVDDSEMTVPTESWGRLEDMIKGNLVRLSTDVAKLKQQAEIDRKFTVERLERLEKAVEQTNYCFQLQLQQVTSGIKSRTLLNEINDLKEVVEANQAFMTAQLSGLEITPDMSFEKLKKRIESLEKVVEETNTSMMHQMELLEDTPIYEMQEVKDQVNSLEILLKRYILEMNQQLIQTRKEVSLQERGRRRSYRPYE